MPTENDQPLKLPPKIVTNVQPGAPVAPPQTTIMDGDWTAERVDLPSAKAGKAIYPNSPAQHGFVMVRPITTQEEEILATERFWRQGIALDMVLGRCILTKGINTLDLLSGDRTHLLMYLRTISFGPKYSFDTVLKGGVSQTIETDVSKLKIKTIDENFQEPATLQVDGTTYEFRLSRGSDEQAVIQARLRVLRKDPKSGAEPSPRETLKRALVSVNGDSTPEVVAHHVDVMISGKAQRIRREIAAVTPGPVLELEVTNEQTGLLEQVNFQMTEGFFRS